MDFKEIVDSLFINRKKYHLVTDEEKESNFFIINRKLSRKYPKIAEFFNDKSIDKSSALDRWFYFFKDTKRIPSWYWGKKGNKIKNKSDIKEKDIRMLRNKFDLKESDIDFLYKYYNKELLMEIKK